MNATTLEEILLSLESGARPKGGVSADSGEIPSLGGEHLNADGGFDFTSIKRIPRLFFESMRSGRIAKQDILIVKDGATTGKTSIVRDDFPFAEAAVNEHVFCVRVDPRRASPAFVYHFLRSERGQKAIHLDFRGATVGGISREFAAKTRIPLPPLAEQRRIAEILDRGEALRVKRRALLAGLEPLSQALFLELFGDPRDPPSNRTIVCLGELLRFVTSGGRGWAAFYSPAGSRFIRSLDVRMNHISDEDAVCVTPPDNAEARRTRVEAGDVLLTITGSRIGRVAPVPERLSGAYISQHVAILRPDSRRVLPHFLSFFLSLDTGGQRQIVKAQYGQTKPGLNFEQIRHFQVPLPSLTGQQKFVSQLEAVEDLKTAQGTSLTELDALFASLQHRAFRAEL